MLKMGVLIAFIPRTLSKNITAVVMAVFVIVAHTPPQIGTGWDQNLWSPAKPLTKHDLDAALLCGRPCLLYRRCWHAVVVNSAALRAAGLDPDKAWSSPDNASAAEDNEDGGAGRAEDAGGRAAGGEGGRVKIAPGGKPEGIDVDGDGLPTGLFREGSMRLVESAITAPAFEIRCFGGWSCRWWTCFSNFCGQNR